VESTRLVALAIKWEDTSTIISKVHCIAPMKAAVDDKYCLVDGYIFIK